MMPIYKITYADYDAYDEIELYHEKRFSANEIHFMVQECIDNILQHLTIKDTPCLINTESLFSPGLSIEMERRYGFKAFYPLIEINLDNNYFLSQEESPAYAERYKDIILPECENCFNRRVRMNKKIQCPVKNKRYKIKRGDEGNVIYPKNKEEMEIIE